MGVLKDTLRVWSYDRLEPPVLDALKRLARAEDVVRVAAMPDVHLAKEVCVGIAVATRNTLYPSAVGGDIGCGMDAVRLAGLESRDIDEAAATEILTGLSCQVPIRQHANAQPLPASLLDELSATHLQSKQQSLAKRQLGTLGRGNHFVELQRADDGLWLMVHSGSRGMGQSIRDHHLKMATRRRGGLRGLDADSQIGQRYLQDLDWALRYAQENRRKIVGQTIAVLRQVFEQTVTPDDQISCHHNMVRQESLQNEMFWVHRKGAISAQVGEAGVVPGSMGTESFHVVGRGHVESLCSSSHGAGRTMSRAAAARRISIDALKEQMRGVWYDQTLNRRLRDEAPGAYKDIRGVMRAQRDLTRVVRRLQPLLVYKGG